jgi:hypothetical protein
MFTLFWSAVRLISFCSRSRARLHAVGEAITSAAFAFHPLLLCQKAGGAHSPGRSRVPKCIICSQLFANETTPGRFTLPYELAPYLANCIDASPACVSMVS